MSKTESCWVCPHCGKTQPAGKRWVGWRKGWDESCALHAVWARPATPADETDGKWIGLPMVDWPNEQPE